MKVLQIIKMAIRRFDEQANNTGHFDQDSYELLLDLVNEGYIDICRKTHCKRSAGILNLVKDVQEYDLSILLTGFSSLKQLSYTGPDNQFWIIQRDKFENRSNQSGTPIYGYYQDGNTLGFMVKPNGGYALDVIYYSIPTEELTIGDTPLLIPYEWQVSLVYYLVYQMFQIDKGAVDGKNLEWEQKYNSKVYEMAEHFMEGANSDKYLPV